MRPPPRVDIEHNDAFAAVKRDQVDQRRNRRNDVVAAHADKFIAYGFGIGDAFDPQRVGNAENDRSAVGIRQCDDALRDLFRI